MHATKIRGGSLILMIIFTRRKSIVFVMVLVIDDDRLELGNNMIHIQSARYDWR